MNRDDGNVPIDTHPFNTTDRFHYYRFVIDDGQGMLFIDGSSESSLVGEIGEPNQSRVSRPNEVGFGDCTANALSEVDVKSFWFANNARAKSPFHPNSVLFQSRSPSKAKQHTTQLKQALNKSLILHYKLDRHHDDGLVPDETDHGSNATEHVSSKVTGGLIGKAFPFNGKSESLIRSFDPESGLHPSDSPFTISAWFKTSSESPLEQAVVSTHYAGAGHDGYKLTIDLRDNYNGKLLFMIGAGKHHVLMSNKPCNDGCWHHAAGVWAGKSASLYVDGVRQCSLETTGSIPYSNRAPFVVGHSKSAGGPQSLDKLYCFQGAIDEMRFYNQALPAKDIAALASLE